VESFRFRAYGDAKVPLCWMCRSECCLPWILCDEVQRVVFYDSTWITERHGRVLGTSGTEQDALSQNHIFHTIHVKDLYYVIENHRVCVARRGRVRQAGLDSGSLVMAWQSLAWFLTNRNRSRRIKSNFARRQNNAPYVLHLQMRGSWNPRRERTRGVELSSREFPPVINL
jgi:hypothetical protein